MVVELTPITCLIGVTVVAVFAFLVLAFLHRVRAHPIAAERLPAVSEPRPGMRKFTMGVLLLLALVQLPLAYSFAADGTNTIAFVPLLALGTNLGTAFAYRKPRKGSLYVYALIALQAVLLISFISSFGVNPIEVLFVILQGMVLLGMALLWRTPGPLTTTGEGDG